jgi:hypothetical protein
MGAELAAVPHDALGDRGAHGLVVSKRAVDVVMGRERIGERAGVVARLGDAEAHMRARARRRIAQQDDAAEHHPGRAEIVDRREEGPLDLLERVEEGRRQLLLGLRMKIRDKVGADQRRGDRIGMLVPVGVDAHLSQRLGVADAVPDEIIAPATRTRVVVETRDRVADDLLALRQEEGEMRKDAGACLRREVGLIWRPAPDVIAGIDRLDLRRHLGAHAGADAVAADEKVGALAAPAGKLSHHLAAVLVGALELVAQVIAFGRDRVAQQSLQPVPRGQDLRERLVGDHPALAVDRDAPLDRDAEIARAGARELERLQQFRMGGDAGAAPDQLDPADLAQEGRREQAGHRPADRDRAPAASTAWLHPSTHSP